MVLTYSLASISGGLMSRVPRALLSAIAALALLSPASAQPQFQEVVDGGAMPEPAPAEAPVGSGHSGTLVSHFPAPILIPRRDFPDLEGPSLTQATLQIELFGTGYTFSFGDPSDPVLQLDNKNERVYGRYDFELGDMYDDSQPGALWVKGDRASDQDNRRGIADLLSSSNKILWWYDPFWDITYGLRGQHVKALGGAPLALSVLQHGAPIGGTLSPTAPVVSGSDDKFIDHFRGTILVPRPDFPWIEGLPLTEAALNIRLEGTGYAFIEGEPSDLALHLDRQNEQVSGGYSFSLGDQRYLTQPGSVVVSGARGRESFEFWSRLYEGAPCRSAGYCAEGEEGRASELSYERFWGLTVRGEPAMVEHDTLGERWVIQWYDPVPDMSYMLEVSRDAGKRVGANRRISPDNRQFAERLSEVAAELVPIAS